MKAMVGGFIFGRLPDHRVPYSNELPIVWHHKRKGNRDHV